MRGGRWAVGGAAVLALLVACIWLVPGMLDWNRYRDSIAALFAAGLGRPVRIEGDVTLHLLPQPILTATRITMDDTGDGVVLTAQELRLRVGLGPLLAGQVDARDVVVRGADLHLPWPPAPGALAQRPPAWLKGLQARLEDSRITIGGLALTGIEARVATDPETGTLSTGGSGRLGGRDWRFQARLARPGRDGAAGLEISLDGQDRLRDTGGVFSGQIGGDGALAGRVSGRGTDLSQLLQAPAVPWKAEGRLGATAGLAVADELAVEIDGSPARGAVALRVTPEPRLDLALAAGRLDLDAWLPVLMQGPQLGIPTGIDLSAEAAGLGGGVVRRLRGAFDLDAAGVTIREMTALLPGDAPITLRGRIPGSPPVFDGTLQLQSPDFRATLDWLRRLVPAAGAGALPVSTPRRAELAGRVVIGQGQAAFQDVQGQLDGAAMTGSGMIRARPRPGFTASVQLARLIVDPWLPEAGRLDTPSGLADLLARLTTVDADLRLQVAQAEWRGWPVGNAGLELQAEAGRVMVRRVEGTLLGVKVAASGGLAGSEGGGVRLADVRVEMATPNLDAVRGALPAEWQKRLGMVRGAGSALLLLAGPAEAVQARLSAEIGDLRLEAQPTVNLAIRRWSGPLTVRHPGAPRFLDAAGFGNTVAWLGDGSLSALAQVTAAPGRIAVDGLDLAAGSLRARGQLVLEGSPMPTGVTGSIVAEILPLPLPYAFSPEPLPIDMLLGRRADVRIEAGEVLLGQAPALRDFAAHLVLQDGVVRLNQVIAAVDGGKLTGAATLDAARDPPVITLQADVAGVALTAPPAGRPPVDVAAGVADASLKLTAAGYSPAALLATLSGPVRIDVRDGVMSGIDLPAAAAALSERDAGRVSAQMRQALMGGASPFERLNLTLGFSRGVARVDGALAGPAGDAQIAGALDMPGTSVDLRLALRPVGPDTERPEIGLRLNGPWSNPARTPELAALSRWLAERP